MQIMFDTNVVEDTYKAAVNYNNRYINVTLSAVLRSRFPIGLNLAEVIYPFSFQLRTIGDSAVRCSNQGRPSIPCLAMQSQVDRLRMA